MTKLTSIIVGGALGLTLAASVGVGVAVGNNAEFKEAKAAELVYAQATFNATNNSKGINSYSNSWSNTTNGFTWNMTNWNNNNNGWEYVKCGYSTAAINGTIETAEAVPVSVSKVTITIDAITANKTTSITLYGGANGTTSLGTFTKAVGTQTVTISNPSKNQKYKIVFVCEKTSKNKNGAVTLSNVSLYSKDATLTLNKSQVDLSLDNTEGVKVAATVINVDNPTYTWSTSATNISLVNANTSEVTIKPSGSTTGTATVNLTVGGYSPTLTASVTVGVYHQPYTVADACAAIDAGYGLTDVVTNGIISQVDSYDSTHKSITYWISDDGSTTNQLEVYSGKGLNGADFTAVTDIEVGAIVSLQGNLKKYNSTYEYDMNSKQLSCVVKTLTSISVSGNMSKTLYSDGSQWNPAGLVVTAHYSDNTTSNVTGGVTWTYNPATPTLGTTSVVATASFGGFTASSSTQSVVVATTPYTNGIPYKMYFYSTQLSSNYYFSGSMDGYYGATTQTKGDGVDVFFENNSVEGQNIYFMDSGVKSYIYVSVSVSDNTTHYNFAYKTSVPENGWGYNGECITYDISGTAYTLGTYGTFTTFGASPAFYTTNYKVQFEVADSVNAESWSTDFLAKMTCDSTGATAPTFASGYTWADFQVMFSQLPTAEQQTLYNATANDGGTVVQQAMARYDYVVAKYGYYNFINRTVSNSANRMNGIIDNNRVVVITAALALLSTTSFAAYYMLRKKKLA